jgi:hypothetical protein
MRSYLTYVRKVWRCSWSETSRFFGGWRAIILPLLGFIGGLSLHWLASLIWDRFSTLRLPPVMDEIIVFVLYGLAGTVLVGVLAFAVNLVLAPYRLYRDACARADALERETAELQEDMKEATRTVPQAALAMEYDPAKHLTRHPNGDVDVRLLVKNQGPGSAQRVRVKLESLVAKTNKRKAAAFSTQFNAVRLQVVREPLGFTLHEEDVAEVILLRVSKNDDFFHIPGYNAREEAKEFRTPRAKYHLTIVASSMNAKAARMEFIVASKKGGGISFTPASGVGGIAEPVLGRVKEVRAPLLC